MDLGDSADHRQAKGTLVFRRESRAGADLARAGRKSRHGLFAGAKISYDFTKQISGGLEYYADYGSITNIASLHNQQQQFFPAIDLNVSPNWEINFGVGIGPTAATDHWIVKGIVGRRFDWGRKGGQ